METFSPAVQDEYRQASSWAQQLQNKINIAIFGAPKLSVERVTQLDAQQFDQELNLMLSWQLQSVFKYFRPELLTRFKPELDAILHGLIWRYTIARDRPTPGGHIQNVQHVRSVVRAAEAEGKDYPTLAPGARLTSKQKLLFGLLSVGGRWLWARMHKYMQDQGWGLYEQVGRWMMSRGVLVLMS